MIGFVLGVVGLLFIVAWFSYLFGKVYGEAYREQTQKCFTLDIEKLQMLKLTSTVAVTDVEVVTQPIFDKELLKHHVERQLREGLFQQILPHIVLDKCHDLGGMQTLFRASLWIVPQPKH